MTAAEYLHTSFEHDADFLAGQIAQRPAPSFEHCCLQPFVGSRLAKQARPPEAFALIEQRIRVAPDRYRVADVCLVDGRPAPEDRGIITTPPHLCVEILSPDDDIPDVLLRVNEYREMGVPWIWVIDPQTCQGEIYSASGVTPVTNMIFRTDRFNVDLSSAHAALR